MFHVEANLSSVLLHLVSLFKIINCKNSCHKILAKLYNLIFKKWSNYLQVLGVSCMKQTSLQFFFILSIWIHSYYVRSAGPWTNFYKVQNTRRVFLAYIFPDFTSVTLKQQHSDQFEPLLLRCVFSTAFSPWYLFWNIKKNIFSHHVNWHHLLIRGHSTTTLCRT